MTETRCIEIADAWDWRDHLVEFVNADISLDLSQTLWDELTQNELELRSLFSTPNIDALLADSATLFQSSSSSSSSSQESSVEGDSDGTVLLRGTENPRFKKRRLFNGPQQTTTYSDDICEDAAAVEEASAMMLVPPPLQSFTDPLPQNEEEGHGILSSMPAIWYASNDDSQSCLGDNQMEEPTMMMMSSENWMAICIEDNNNDTMALNGSHDHTKKTKKKEELTGIAKPTPGGLTPLKISNEEGVLQGPLTPFSSRPSTPVNRTIAVTKLKASRSTPVAYPFTLVKPLGTEGDMTLMDINQLISTTPPRSNSNNNNTTTTTTLITTSEGGSGGSGSINSSSSNSTSYTRDPRPNTKEVDYGVGLSGKSIVTRTRICTKGNGTITIMRTKG